MPIYSVGTLSSFGASCPYVFSPPTVFDRSVGKRIHSPCVTNKVEMAASSRGKGWNMSCSRVLAPTIAVLILVCTGCSDRSAKDSGVPDYEWRDIDQLLEETRAVGEKRLEEEVARREERLQRDATYRDRRDKLGERAEELYDRYEKLQDRREALIERQEKQADRFDAILKKWEEAALAPNK